MLQQVEFWYVTELFICIHVLLRTGVLGKMLAVLLTF